MANDNASGGAGNATGGADAGNKGGDSNTQTQTQENKTVKWEDHQRALSDMHTFKKEVQDLKTKLAERETQDAEKSGNYQKLYETEKAKVGDLDKRLKEVIAFNSDTHRLNEVRAAALAAGLRKDALADLELLDLSDLPVELTNRGRYIVEGVSTFVEGLKTSRGHWFQNAAAPNVNSGGGAPPPGNKEITPVDVVNAELKWKSSRSQQDQAAYIKLHADYNEQEKKKRKAS